MLFGKKSKLLKQAQLEIDNLKRQNNSLQVEIDELRRLNSDITAQYAPLIDRDRYLSEKQASIDLAEQKLLDLNGRYQAATKVHNELSEEINLYKDSLEIGSFGLYEPQFNFETSEIYKINLETNYIKQKNLITADQAVVCKTEWEVGGSKAEGKRMTAKYKKLMLYAFNGECDSLITKVKWNNVLKIKERILKAYDAINKLGESHTISITKQFCDLKLEELAMTYEYEQKKYEEKEEQRRIREQMRDEERAQRELERAQKDAEDEERRFQKALDKARQELSSGKNIDALSEQIQILEQKLQEAHEKKERAISLAQQTKVGHIYVISNLGSFGEDVYKIGMTRRLDPHDRVKELGDASVPFQFDVHAIIYSENAPQLEYELHQKFNDKRLNRINKKKEFFRVTLDEIEEFVKQHTNAGIEFTKLSEAREYRETLTLLQQLNTVVETYSVKSKFPESLI